MDLFFSRVTSTRAEVGYVLNFGAIKENRISTSSFLQKNHYVIITLANYL